MFILLLFVLLVTVAVLTLTPRTEFGKITQASIAVFVAAVLYILSIISSDVSNEDLHKLDMENRLKEFVQRFLNESQTESSVNQATLEHVSPDNLELGQSS